MKRLTILGFLLLAAVSMLNGQNDNSEFILGLKNSQALGRINRDYRGTTLKQAGEAPVFLVRLENADSKSIDKLQKDSDVEFLESNSSIDLSDSAETVYLLDDSAETVYLLDGNARMFLNGVDVPRVYGAQTALSIIEADKVRNVSTGAATRVAIIDTGVDFGHPALRPWLDPGVDLVNGRSASEFDSLSLADSAETVYLLDNGTLTRNPALPPAFGHGTMVAGIVHLVAPDAVIVPIKAFDAYGRTTMFSIIDGVYRAVDLRVDVLNMSFSTGIDSKAMRTAINKAKAAGISVVASMGNGGRNDERVYPAAYTGVFGVAATDFQDRAAPFSNYGKSVSLSAPGAYVISTVPGGRYAVAWGTSFSAPLVSGAMALVASLQPHGNSQSMMAVTTAESIDAKNPGLEKLLGKGRVNARLALQR